MRKYIMEKTFIPDMGSMSTHTPERLRCEVCDLPTLGDTLCNHHYDEQEHRNGTTAPALLS